MSMHPQLCRTTIQGVQTECRGLSHRMPQISQEEQESLSYPHQVMSQHRGVPEEELFLLSGKGDMQIAGCHISCVFQDGLQAQDYVKEELHSVH